MQTAQTKTVAKTVENMINEIGLLRQLVAIDCMPIELQQARHLLRQLDERLKKDVQK
jgi:hypothetical protein